jgi:hypothetical protein
MKPGAKVLGDCLDLPNPVMDAPVKFGKPVP